MISLFLTAWIVACFIGVALFAWVNRKLRTPDPFFGLGVDFAGIDA